MNFIKSIIKGFKDSIIKTVTNIFGNFEAVILLTLASIGLTFLLSELPFIISIPLFIESLIVVPLILPVISASIITGIVVLMKQRFENSHSKEI